MFRSRIAPALISPCLLLLAACGGGDDAAPTATTAASDASSPAATAELTATPEPTATLTAEEAADEALRRAATRTRDFIATDYPLNNSSVATVELHEIIPVLPRDGIQSIDNPKFDDVATANEWLDEREPVIAFQLNGEARAYPLRILTWHEIVNDEVAGEPVIVTYCPLCNTAIAFRRTVDGSVREFGVSGALRRNDLIMYDRQTETLWQQITGEAIVGDAAGTRLDFLPAQIASWGDFRDSFPEALVLNRDTGSGLPYGDNPYPLYDQPGSSTLFRIDEFDDKRLDAKERVLTVDLGNDPIAFPFSALTQAIVLEGESAGTAVVAFWQSGALSPLDGAFIVAGRNIGAAAAFRPVIDGAPATFEVRDGLILDAATGSQWNVLGLAVAGPLTGTQLDPVISANHFWFAWAVFAPGTRVITD